MAKTAKPRYSSRTGKPKIIDHDGQDAPPSSAGDSVTSDRKSEPLGDLPSAKSLAPTLRGNNNQEVVNDNPVIKRSAMMADANKGHNEEAIKSQPTGNSFGKRTTDAPKDNQDNGKTMTHERKEESAAKEATATTNYAAIWLYFLSGIAGGIVVILVTLVLQFFHVLPTNFFQNSDLSALQTMITTLKHRVDTLDGTSNQLPEAAELQKNFAKLAEVQSEARSLTTQFANLEQRITNLETERQADSSEATEPNNEQIDHEISALKQDLTAMAMKSAEIDRFSKENNEDLKTLRQDVNTLLQAKHQRHENLALLVAAQALKSAVDRGGSFKDELALVEKTAPEQSAVKILQPFAATGLPNGTELANNFTVIADKIAATQNSAPSGAGIFSKIWHKLTTLVTARPLGNVDGTTPAAIAARMEYALGKGDNAKVVAEWENLPQDGKEMSADFIEKLRARISADQVLSDLIARAMPQPDQ